MVQCWTWLIDNTRRFMLRTFTETWTQTLTILKISKQKIKYKCKRIGMQLIYLDGLRQRAHHLVVLNLTIRQHFNKFQHTRKTRIKHVILLELIYTSLNIYTIKSLTPNIVWFSDYQSRSRINSWKEHHQNQWSRQLLPHLFKHDIYVYTLWRYLKFTHGSDNKTSSINLIHKNQTG